jgi:hypothetical protein
MNSRARGWSSVWLALRSPLWTILLPSVFAGGTPIASLDDPAVFAPQEAIFLEDKLPWVMIDESLPSFPKTPRTA